MAIHGRAQLLTLIFKEDLRGSIHCYIDQPCSNKGEVRIIPLKLTGTGCYRCRAIFKARCNREDIVTSREEFHELLPEPARTISNLYLNISRSASYHLDSTRAFMVWIGLTN